MLHGVAPPAEHYRSVTTGEAAMTLQSRHPCTTCRTLSWAFFFTKRSSSGFSRMGSSRSRSWKGEGGPGHANKRTESLKLQRLCTSS